VPENSGNDSRYDRYAIYTTIQCLQKHYNQSNTGVESEGYAGDLTPQILMWRDIDMYIPLEKNLYLSIIHADCICNTY